MGFNSGFKGLNHWIDNMFRPIHWVIFRSIQKSSWLETRTYNCIDLKMSQWMGRNMLSIQWFNKLSQFGYTTAVLCDCSVPVYTSKYIFVLPTGLQLPRVKANADHFPVKPVPRITIIRHLSTIQNLCAPKKPFLQFLSKAYHPSSLSHNS